MSQVFEDIRYRQTPMSELALCRRKVLKSDHLHSRILS
jgi:hypothetical protein